MKHILFVDDEQALLSGLRRMLRGQRRVWKMGFAHGGEEALKYLAQHQVDVVVSDMRMPGMDGFELLKTVQEKYPKTIRMVLSGQTQLEAALRVSAIVHQFLSKPCSPANLQRAIERALDVHALFSNDAIHRMIGKMNALPTLPKTFQALQKALQDADVDLSKVAKLIEKDIGISAKILKTVNSGYFGLRRTVSNMAQATNLLGLSTVKNLVLSSEVFAPKNLQNKVQGYSLTYEQHHGLLVGKIAAHFMDDPREADDAFMAGLLHDIGKLVLVMQQQAYAESLWKEAAQKEQSLYATELERGEVTHAALGGYLLGLWGMPFPIVEAVAHHHDPLTIEQESFGVLAAVYVANTLVHEVVHPDTAPPLNEAYLEKLEVAHHIPDWRAFVQEACHSNEIPQNS